MQNGVVLNVNDLYQNIIAYIESSNTKLTYGSLKHHFCSIIGYDRKIFKTAIKDLINDGALVYSNHFGRNFIEISFHIPRKISTHIVLKPPDVSYVPDDHELVIQIEHGSSFGGGDHPTTQLCINLLDNILTKLSATLDLQKIKSFDIGTGSGVLAIAAAKLGMGFVAAVDIDPCAIYEAKRNVMLNNLGRQIAVSDDELEDLVGKYGLGIANLRTPTLKKLSRLMERKLKADAFLLLSGMKSTEVADVAKTYAEIGFAVYSKSTKKVWSALSLVRGRFSTLV